MTTKLDPIPEETPQVEESISTSAGGENKSTPEMPVPKTVEPELRITNPEGDKDGEANPKRTQVNKKLSAMSMNTKEKQKNRRLSKPTSSSIPQGSLSKMLNISPMYLLGIIGVVIAGISLWYQRKSYLQDKDKEKDPPDLEKDLGGESTTEGFVHSPSDLRGTASFGRSPEPKKSPEKKHKDPHLDPWEWQQHHQQTGILPNPGVFNFN